MSPPFGYMAENALVAISTCIALAPPRPRRSSLRNKTYLVGFIVSELPFVVFYLVLASTLLALGQGDLYSPGGWSAFAVAVATSFGLAIVVARALGERETIEGAMIEGLGVGWRGAIDDAAAARFRRHLPWARILLRPMFVRRRDVERIADVVYGDAGRHNRLDLYRRRAGRGDGPTLVYLHGGGFRTGRKNREARPLIYRLASQGWTCISANYRLAPAASYADELIDVKRVIAWVREHGHEYGARTQTVFLAGSSAGGHLASVAALTPNDRNFQPGFEQVDTRIAAVISMYGYYGSPDGQTTSSPVHYLRPDAPPFFVAHGRNDTMVLVEDAREFVGRLRQISTRPIVYSELSGAQHTFDMFHSIRFEQIIDAIEAFAAWVVAQQSVSS